MKLKFTVWTSAFIFLLFSSGLFGQITINRADYLMQLNQTDSALEMSSINFPVPSSGSNQLWDYSSYTTFPFNSIFDYDSTSNSDFPTANQDVWGDFVFQGGYYIVATDYLSLTPRSYVDLGKVTQYAVYSIANRTGGANDSIYFPQDNRVYNVPDTLLKFPMNYLDSNTSKPLDTSNFQLSVASYGLNKTPGQVIYDRSITNIIGGSGKLLIPQPGGAVSDTMDVLLNRRIETRRDSIFLNGNPAPAPLLAAFGLTQGQIVLDTIYRFYRKGYKNTIAEIDYQNGDVLFFYNADQTTSLNELKVYKNLKVFPNPINAGEVFQFESFDNIQNGLISIIDIQGKVISSESGNISFKKQFSIPTSTKAGIYFVELVDIQKNEKYITKIIIR